MSGSERYASGRLKSRVTLQQPVLTPDGGGGYERAWEDVADVWAEIAPFEARTTQMETLQDMRLQSRLTHRITLRYRAGVTADQRILYGERVFNIRAVINPLEADAFLVVLAEEGVA